MIMKRLVKGRLANLDEVADKVNEIVDWINAMGVPERGIYNEILGIKK